MRIHEQDINWYVGRLADKDYYSFAGYSDAEWYCILKERVGGTTAAGQVIDAAHGERLMDIIRRRHKDKRFLFAVPKCLRGLPAFVNGEIDWLLGREDIRMEAYERDMVTDTLAEQAGLFPFVDQIRSMPAVMIGNAGLRGMVSLLRLRHFVEISTPNLHLEPGGIERAVEQTLSYGEPGVYLVSAGVSAAVIIDMLHDKIKNSFFLDCGSIWDAFVRIGGQRAWRAELYADKGRWNEWMRSNLRGPR